LSQKCSFIHRLLQRLRIASQIFFFCLFLYLLLSTHFSGKDYIGPVESFFHFDPLLGLTTFLSSRIFLITSLWALTTVVLTVLVGRFACGWACPFDALLQFVSYLFKKLKWHTPKPAGRQLLQLKYGILAVIPVPSGVGLVRLGDSLTEFLQNLTINKTYNQGLMIGLIFLGVILLSLYRERFWCQHLCPAGALLALLSRRNLTKIKVDPEKCMQCEVCSLHCQTQATPFPGKKWQPSECIYCYTCAARCPTKAITFPLLASPADTRPVDVPRSLSEN
jgi:polyferredoxin